MRILLVHNHYQEIGGEDAVFTAEMQLLKRHGHAVDWLRFDNDAIPNYRSPLAAARLAGATVWSRDAAQQVREAVRECQPDVVHFHNTFPLISPAAYSACKREREDVLVVQTLHNYRLICPNALLFRDGHPCEACVSRTPPWPGVVHACYRHSRSQTAVAATMLTVHRLRRTWQREVDLYLALTAFSREKFIAGGLPPDRISVKPHFLDPDPGGSPTGGEDFLFVGRLVDYKGIESLLEAWTDGGLTVPLHIAGDGPLRPSVERKADEHPAITYLGQLSRPSILKQMHMSRALIIPSLLYENFPVTIVEAFACGLPVIGSRLGAIAEIVEHGRTGLLFNPGDPADLAAKVVWAAAHPDELRKMGAEARREYEAKYTAERNYQLLADAYALGIERARQSQLILEGAP